MAGLLLFSVCGNVGRDAELKTTPSGEQVLDFSVAASTKIKGEAHTEWVRCSVWGKRATALAPYVKKGSQVYVSGEGKKREYTDKEGVFRASLEITVQHLSLMGGKQDTAAPPAPPSSKPSSRNDEDTPF